MASYQFDGFTVDPVRRQICHHDVPVPVPQKVFQVLLVLMENPGTAQNAGRLATTLLYLNRIDEAKALLLDAAQRHADAPVLHYYLYETYFLQNDSASMAREASFLRMQPGWSDNMLQLESLSASYLGKFSLAHSLGDEAAEHALHEKDNEGAAGVMAEAALQDALAGNNAGQEKSKSGFGFGDRP